MFEESERGSRGVRVFLVDTPDPRNALAVTGVPAMGASWSSSADDVTCRTRTATVETGAKPDPTFESVIGWCKVTCTYATADLNSGGGSLPPEARTPGAAYSEYEFSDGTTTVHYDIDGQQVNGEQGATVESATLEIRVRQFLAEAPQPSAFIGLIDTVNSAAFTLPPPYGAETSIVLQPGEGLFRTPKLAVTTDSAGEPIVEVTWRFGVAPDWLFRWRKFNADGDPVGPIIESVVYESEDWGAVL